MSKRNKALAMALRRALLLIADAIKVWCDTSDDELVASSQQPA